MQTLEAILTEQGQITIPQPILYVLGLHPGDKIRFTIEDQTITISRVTSILPYFGSIPPRNKPEDFQELREEFEQGVAREVISEDESNCT